MSDNLNAVRTAEPEVMAWIEAKLAKGNDFAASLHSFASRKGYLSPGQISAVLNGIKREAEMVELAKNAPSVDTTRLEAVFAVATGKGLKKPALTIGDLRFNPAPETGANPGAIYVKQDGTYMGKMLRGQFITRTTGEFVSKVLAIAGDPEGEAIKHGKLTGRCAVCSRKLSDPESVDRGIGPVCAEKFGW